jgi:drug/metabolite transporter (DMT)-like permease
MHWIAFALASGLLNALWTSRIQGRVAGSGPIAFAASIRLGVALVFLPVLVLEARGLSARWWWVSGASGALESLSLVLTVRGFQQDYYSTYALSNINPLFVVLLASAFLGEALTPGLIAGGVLAAAGALLLYYRGHFNVWGLGAALAVAVSKVLSKAVIAEANPLAQAGAAFLAGALVLAVWAGLKPASQRGPGLVPDLWRNRWLVLGSGATTFCFYEALSQGPVGPVSLLSRGNLIVGFGLSYWTLGERRDWPARALGAALIFAGIVLAL